MITRQLPSASSIVAAACIRRSPWRGVHPALKATCLGDAADVTSTQTQSYTYTLFLTLPSAIPQRVDHNVFQWIASIVAARLRRGPVQGTYARDYDEFAPRGELQGRGTA
jgi:hypothetical protein